MVNIVLFQQQNYRLINHLARADQNFFAYRADHVYGNRSTENPISQRNNHLTALNPRFTQDTVSGAAIGLDNHKILADIHQSPGKIAGVGGFQRCICKTLTSAMG